MVPFVFGVVTGVGKAAGKLGAALVGRQLHALEYAAAEDVLVMNVGTTLVECELKAEQKGTTDWSVPKISPRRWSIVHPADLASACTNNDSNTRTTNFSILAVLVG